MRNDHHDDNRTYARRGFTLLELLVTVSIMALLMSLAAPALLNARQSARQLQCKNRMRNIAIALLGFESAHGRLPASGNFSAVDSTQHHSWVVDMLPYCDRVDLFDRYNKDEAFNSADNSRVADLGLEVLICPDDVSVIQGRGNLSYVVNSGFAWTVPDDCPVSLHSSPGTQPTITGFDFNGDGVVCPLVPVGTDVSDKQLFKMTSLFFVENYPPGSGTVRHHSIDSVYDGASNTFLLSENVRAGFDPTTDDNWASPEPRRNSFFLSSFVCDNGTCSPGNVDFARANDQGAEPYRFESLNSSLLQGEGSAPWPSAYHNGVIHFAFCDGRVSGISEDIDGSVYASLVTPQGTRITGELWQPVFSSGITD